MSKKNMKDYFPYYLHFLSRHIVRELVNRYGLTPMEALQRFLNSETYRMASAPELAMWEFSDAAIFEMWECEQITGNPRNSSYLRCE